MTSLQSQFEKYANYGQAASTSGGSLITLSNIDKWFKQAGVFTKNFTTTDTGIHFGKLKEKKANYADFERFLEDVIKTKKLDPSEIKGKLINCGEPGHAAGSTKTTNVGGVDRLTDTSKYTGSHKERFDESGKGKGISGREDVADNEGYVSGYKEKDTYDKKH